MFFLSFFVVLAVAAGVRVRESLKSTSFVLYADITYFSEYDETTFDDWERTLEEIEDGMKICKDPTTTLRIYDVVERPVGGLIKLEVYSYVDFEFPLVQCLKSSITSLAMITVSEGDVSVSNVVPNNVAVNQTSINFFLLGDWGKGGNTGDLTGEAQKWTTSSSSISLRGSSSVYYTYQAAVATLMANLASKYDINSVIALGDNFYNDGVQSTTDSQWSTQWSLVYFERFPILKRPWYAILGNHDWGYGISGVEAQLEKTFVDSYELWNMPSRNYLKVTIPLN